MPESAYLVRSLAGDLLFENEHFPGRGSIQARNGIDHGALACSIRSYKAVNRAFSNIEAEIVNSHETAEPDRNLSELQRVHRVSRNQHGAVDFERRIPGQLLRPERAQV